MDMLYQSQMPVRMSIIDIPYPIAFVLEETDKKGCHNYDNGQEDQSIHKTKDEVHTSTAVVFMQGKVDSIERTKEGTDSSLIFQCSHLTSLRLTAVTSGPSLPLYLGPSPFPLKHLLRHGVFPFSPFLHQEYDGDWEPSPPALLQAFTMT